MTSQPNEAPAAPSAPTLDRALDLVRFLRQNCPWDAAQTPESLIPYLLEEAHEVADAILRIADQGSRIRARIRLLLSWGICCSTWRFRSCWPRSGRASTQRVSCGSSNPRCGGGI